MPCDRCGAEPDADLVRFAAYERDEEVQSVELCPGCAYGLNTLTAAYVARRELPASATEPVPPGGGALRPDRP